MTLAKILVIFGTRPEAIKLAPVVTALRECGSFDVRICVTAQHREMLDQVLSLFGIASDHDLDLMQPNQDLLDLTSRMLTGIRGVIEKERPDIAMVQGDTTTCFVGALAAFYLGVPIAHVEAGLRTHDLKAPFPEEANRRLTATLARFHFAPTEQARSNLLAENVDPSRIWVTGNTGIDALFRVRSQSTETAPIDTDPALESALRDVGRSPASRLVLITGHRRENFGSGIKAICEAIKTLAQNHEDWVFVYPVHPNPNISRPVEDMLGGQVNVHLIAPLHYRDFVQLMDRSHLILTDSGGIQEEAPSLGKPVLVMREATERPEAVEAGTVKLVGADHDTIVRNVEELLTDEAAYRRMARAINPYGDGKAAGRIVGILKDAIEPATPAAHTNSSLVS